MKKSIRNILGALLGLMILLFSTSNSAAETIKLALGSTLPPHVISEKNEGITIDIIKKCLEPAGYQIQFYYFPYARRFIEYRKGTVDAVTNVIDQDMVTNGMKGYLSDPALSYENIVVTLKKNNFRFDRIADLAGHSVVSWQGATNVLCSEYAQMAKENKNYRELADQKKQIFLLFKGRADAIQIDKSIFFYYRNELRKEGRVDVDQAVDIFPLFGETKYGILFRNEKDRDVFNAQFKMIKNSNEYEDIIKRYTQFSPDKKQTE